MRREGQYLVLINYVVEGGEERTFEYSDQGPLPYS